MWKSDYKVGLIDIEKSLRHKDASVIRLWMDRATFRELCCGMRSATEKSNSYPELLPWAKITESLGDLDELIFHALADE